MKVWVKVSWKVLTSGTGGSSYRGTGTAFDTDTKLIAAYTADKYVALLEPAPQDYQAAVGTELHAECAADYTRTAWVYDGGTTTHTTTEANSAACGYSPPLSCDLGALSVSQQAMTVGARVTVAYAGTAHGTVYYSLDGGVEGTSPTFLSVAPGPHVAKARDTAVTGCEPTHSFTVAAPSQPPVPPTGPSGGVAGVDFVSQPLFHTLDDQVPGSSVELTLFAESQHFVGDFAPVLTMRKLAGLDGRVRFRLDTLLRPLLLPFVPPPGSTLNQVTAAVTGPLLNYYVLTGSLAPGPDTVTNYQVSAPRTALRGGLPAEWQATDYFALRQSDAFDAPPFLSWQPSGPGAYAGGQVKEIVPRQPEWLLWLCPLDFPATSALRVRRAYAASATAQPVSDYEALTTPAGGWAGRLLAVPLKDGRGGFAYLGIRLETTDGATVSPEALYRFVPASPRTRFVLFSNSLGGLDTLRCEQRLEVTLEATADVVELPPTGPVYRAPAAGQRVSQVTAGRKLRLYPGWLEPQELAWLQELVLSPDIWQQVGGELRPLDWPKRSLATYSDEPGLRGLVLDFDYAYPATAYAPTTYA